MWKYLRNINLRAFEGEGAGAGGEAGASADGAEQAGTAAADTPPAKPTFDELVNGEYRQAYEGRLQQEVLRQMKPLNEELEACRPVLDALRQRYGVEPGADAKQIMEALDRDEALWTAAAEEAGMTVKQYREMQRMGRENAEMQRKLAEQQEQASKRALLREWERQAGAVKQRYPKFDVRQEARENRHFGELLRRGIDMMTAYEITHKDEIIAQTVQAAEAQTVEKVRRKQARPSENGTGGGAAAKQGTDVRSMSRKELDALYRRAQRGERIVL